MNIPVRTASGKVIVRPDTTWKRDDDSCWMPEFVDSVSWVPVEFVQISRLGKCIGEKFADRYYDAVGFGFLLYPENLIDGSAEGFACASCLDHTTFLSFPTVFNPDFSDDFHILKDGEEIFRCPPVSAAGIRKAIADVTARCLVRRGDLLAIELRDRTPLLTIDRRTRLEAFASGSRLLDIEIVL